MKEYVRRDAFNRKKGFAILPERHFALRNPNSELILKTGTPNNEYHRASWDQTSAINRT